MGRAIRTACAVRMAPCTPPYIPSASLGTQRFTTSIHPYSASSLRVSRGRIGSKILRYDPARSSIASLHSS